ncbi:hypothetical protein NM22_07840 [Vibrio tubiashii]|nr:hypothetical protein NM22_07840 [Vibrio tubiashii]
MNASPMLYSRGALDLLILFIQDIDKPKQPHNKQGCEQEQKTVANPRRFTGHINLKLHIPSRLDLILNLVLAF